MEEAHAPLVSLLCARMPTVPVELRNRAQYATPGKQLRCFHQHADVPCNPALREPSLDPHLNSEIAQANRRPLSVTAVPLGPSRQVGHPSPMNPGTAYVRPRR
jgi:hypothetical protein